MFDLEVSEKYANSNEMMEVISSSAGGQAHRPLSELNW